MFTVAEIPGIYVNLAKQQLYVFDHVEASLEGNQIKITNPTKFDSKIRIFIDKGQAEPFTQGFMSSLPQVVIKAGTSKLYPF